jgi:hypothetical protein
MILQLHQKPPPRYPARLALAAATLSAALSATGSHGQVYRCGNAYSQTPCPDGIPVDVQDPRSADQKAQAQAGVKRQLKEAADLQKERLANEAEAQKLAQREAAGLTKTQQKSAAPPPKVVVKAPPKHAQRKPPEHFTAKGAPVKEAPAKKTD